MPQIALDCPYCQTKQAAFEGSLSLPFKPGSETRFIVLMQCRICGNGIVALFRSPSGGLFSQWLKGVASMDDEHATLLEVFPKPMAITAPQHVPVNVARFYMQGMDNIARNFDAAGVMFRKSLDAALRFIDPAGKGSLEKRIDNLSEAIGVTPAMKGWAHEIRDLGNEAAHEDDPFSEMEVRSLQAFTELFLTYTFTLPGLLKSRKEAAQSSPT